MSSEKIVDENPQMQNFYISDIKRIVAVVPYKQLCYCLSARASKRNKTILLCSRNTYFRSGYAGDLIDFVVDKKLMRTASMRAYSTLDKSELCEEDTYDKFYLDGGYLYNVGSGVAINERLNVGEVMKTLQCGGSCR